MNGTEFSGIRHSLGKSQAQLARLLSVSPRAVQSFEQGGERSAIYGAADVVPSVMSRAQTTRIKPCWNEKNVT